MAGLLACGENEVRSSTDADASMSDTLPPMPDGQLEAPGGPPPTCTSGLCASDACRDGERTDIARGCRFYAAQLDNVDSDDGKQMMLIMTNADQTSSANFRVELHSPDGEWILAVPQGVVPMKGTARVELSRPLMYSGVAFNGAYRITSDSPILVTQIISDDAQRDSTSSSGTVLLPAHALDRHYMALTFSQLAGDTVTATPGSRGGAGVIAVVATADGTSVHVTPKVPALVNDTGILTSGYDALLMSEGDVLQVFSYLPGGDLSGTTIDSDQPVAVFSGNVFTTYGHVAQGLSGGDMALEQMPPLSTWNNEYVGARLSPQAGCDPFLPAGGAMWQVVAAQDNTRITVTPSAGTNVLTNNMSFPMLAQFSLNRGQSSVFMTAPDPDWPGSGSPGDIVVVGSGPLLLAQWLDCDAGLSLGMDTRVGIKTNVTVAFPPGFEQEVLITRRAGTPVTFDDYPIPDDYFQQIAGYEYQVARLTQGQFGSCMTDADMGCQHTIKSSLAGVGVGWRGVDIICSYSLTLPPSDPCVRPMPCVQ